MKVVLAANGSRGDVQPVLVLARALKQRGHDVVLCGTPSFATWVHEIGIAFLPSGLDLQQVMQSRTDIHASTLKLLLHSWRMSREELRSQFRAVADAAAGADLIVSGGSQFSGGSVAARIGAPHVVLAYAPAAFRSASHAPTLVPWVGLPRWINRACWHGYDLLACAMVGRTINTERDRLGLPPVRNVHRDAFAPQHALLAADPELCPLPDDLRDRCTQTAAITLGGDDALPADVEAFLRAGDPPVYLGFGSMVNRDPARMTRILLDAVLTAGVRAVISRGWADLGDAALPSSCLVVGPTAHHALFPRMAAIVHHGGAGTIASAARAGVPQIVVPHIADQFYFGHRIATLRLGPRPIPRARLTAPRLTAALALALDSPVLRRTARDLADRLAPRRGADEAAAALEQLADQRPRLRALPRAI